MPKNDDAEVGVDGEGDGEGEGDDTGALMVYIAKVTALALSPEHSAIAFSVVVAGMEIELL